MNYKKYIFQIWSYSSMIIILSAILYFIYFLSINIIAAFKLINLKQIFDYLYAPFIGTLYVTLLTAVIAVPFGIITGVYISEYSGKFKNKFHTLFRILAGIPSIIVGVYGFSVILILKKYFYLNARPGLIFSGIFLSLLVLPYIINSVILSIESIPEKEKFIGISLGAKKYQNILHFILPRSFPGFFSGIILSIGRAAEDTAVIMLTGAAAMSGIPDSLFSSFEALSYYIYGKSSEYYTQSEFYSIYIAAALIILICMFLIKISKILKFKIDNYYKYGSDF